MKPFQVHEKKVVKTLEKGGDKSVAKAVKHVEKYADKLERNAKKNDDEPGAGELLVQLEGGALAFGEHGLAYVSLNGTLTQSSSVTIVIGSAEALAAATGSGSLAAAYADANVYGADYVYKTTILGHGDSLASAGVQLFAVDYRFLDTVQPRTERIAELEMEAALLIEGHVAHAEAKLAAWGDRTLTLAEMQAIALQEVMASASAEGWIVVG